MKWFEVDRAGLAKVLERRGKAFLLLELVRNAWGEAATKIDVTLERIAGTRNVRLLLHEFGHHFESDHLSDGYHKALTRPGGATAGLALSEPGPFDRAGVAASLEEASVHG